MTNSQPIVYFHGLPGGSTELEAFGDATIGLKTKCFVPNRQSMRKEISLDQSFDMLASAITTRFSTFSVRFVGFSIGAYVALEVANRMGPKVTKIDLVSAAAPLSLGDFLPDMAGKRVFQSARYAPPLLAAITSVQSLALRVAPNKLFNTLFASAQGMDRDLAAQPHFRAKIIEALKQSLLSDASNYRRELTGYVQDWSAILPLVEQPVELWHGKLDNWAPPAMAEVLANMLPNVTSLHRLDGQSHYSTLRTFCAQHERNI
jgi:pimeloyl-ACP methyl ester carboxylesterase